MNNMTNTEECTYAERATDGSGWVVRWANGITPDAFFGDSGGSWTLTRNGVMNRQTAGTRDVRAPRSAILLAAFLRRLAAYEGEKIEVQS